MIPEIWSTMDKMFCHFGLFFGLLPLLPPTPKIRNIFPTQKIKILKKWKNDWRYYLFTHVYNKWRSNDVWFLRCGVWQIFLSSRTIFCPFTLLTAWKIKKFKNEKKRLEISSFYMCTKNHDHMMLSFWDMMCDRTMDRWMDRCEKWHIEVGSPPKNAPAGPSCNCFLWLI